MWALQNVDSKFVVKLSRRLAKRTNSITYWSWACVGQPLGRGGGAQGNEPMSTEYNGYRPSLKLTVSAPYVHRFSPSWDHLSVAGSKS